MDLRYRLAIVTGAGSGLGREIAVGLARLGAAVLVVDRDEASADETVAAVAEARVRGWAQVADVRDEAELRLVAGRARDLGGADLLVNNAGGWTPGGGQWPDAEPAAWSATLDLNLRAPMRLTQLLLADAPLRRGRAAAEPLAVVNVSSDAATRPGAYGSPEYAAAKAGLVRFTTSLAEPRLAGRARVMAVLPGWIGLPRAVDEVAALPPEERAALPPLIPPAAVVRAVTRLLAHGRAGEVVELVGGGQPVA